MDKLNLGGKLFDSRFIMGSGKFDPELISACIDEAKTQIITLAIRRVNQDQNASITKFIPKNTQANTGYKLTLTINSPEGFLPGTYQYQIPNGLMVDGGEGT
ncbi:MAG: hypothetical protein IJ965_02600, partial [Campylobacter sp.]|nr:hypothetical protein [Campylobacter sp.]